MAICQLDIAFTAEQLETIYKKESNVVVAKLTDTGQPNVVWQAFKPLGTNSIFWQEVYGIYASNPEIADGAKLIQLSSTPIGSAMGKLYTMEENGVILGPSSGVQDDSFSLLNKYKKKPYMTIGLYQDASVNGTDIIGNAVSADPLMFEGTICIPPFTTVCVWLQSDVISNSVITDVTAPITELKFGEGANDISVKYDSNSGQFINA